MQWSYALKLTIDQPGMMATDVSRGIPINVTGAPIQSILEANPGLYSIITTGAPQMPAPFDFDCAENGAFLEALPASHMEGGAMLPANVIAMPVQNGEAFTMGVAGANGDGMGKEDAGSIGGVAPLQSVFPKAAAVDAPFRPMPDIFSADLPIAIAVPTMAVPTMGSSPVFSGAAVAMEMAPETKQMDRQ